MTLDEIRTAMVCLTETTAGKRPECFKCKAKPICDDFTEAIYRHITKEKEKTNAEKQQDLLKPASRYRLL